MKIKAASDTKDKSSAKNQVRFDSMREYDDDDDIIYKEENLSSETENESDELSNDNNRNESSSAFSSRRQRMCKHCNSKVNRSNETDSFIVNYNASGSLTTQPSLDLVIFNYAREIYFYEMNDITTQVKLIYFQFFSQVQACLLYHSYFICLAWSKTY